MPYISTKDAAENDRQRQIVSKLLADQGARIAQLEAERDELRAIVERLVYAGDAMLDNDADIDYRDELREAIEAARTKGAPDGD